MENRLNLDERILYSESLKDSIILELKETYRFRHVIYSFVSSSLRQKYRKSWLGFLWALIAPLMQYGITALVFSVMMRGSIERYFVYVFFAALAFSFMSTVVQRSTTVILEHEHFIKKIYVPKFVYILRLVGFELANFFFGFTALVAIGIATQNLYFSWALFFLPISLLISAVFVTGLACFMAVAAVFFRDLVYIVPVVNHSFLFLTPIYYSASIFPKAVQPFLKLNPFYYFIELFRTCVYQGTLPSSEILAVSSVLAVFSFIIGLIILKAFDNVIVFKL